MSSTRNNASLFAAAEPPEIFAGVVAAYHHHQTTQFVTRPGKPIESTNAPFVRPVIRTRKAAAQADIPKSLSSEEALALTPSFRWAVFWDLENVPVPRGVSGDAVVSGLQRNLARLHPSPPSILRIHAAGNILLLPRWLRNQLQANGVTLAHVESRGRKDAADKAIIAEMCLLPAEHNPPFGIVLLSGDGDFAYALARLGRMGYTTVVVSNMRDRMCSSLLASVPNVTWGLREDILDKEPLSSIKDVRCEHLDKSGNERSICRGVGEPGQAAKDVRGGRKGSLQPGPTKEFVKTGKVAGPRKDFTKKAIEVGHRKDFVKKRARWTNKSNERCQAHEGSSGIARISVCEDKSGGAGDADSGARNGGRLAGASSESARDGILPDSLVHHQHGSGEISQRMTSQRHLRRTSRIPPLRIGGVPEKMIARILVSRNQLFCLLVIMFVLGVFATAIVHLRREPYLLQPA